MLNRLICLVPGERPAQCGGTLGQLHAREAFVQATAVVNEVYCGPGRVRSMRFERAGQHQAPAADDDDYFSPAARAPARNAHSVPCASTATLPQQKDMLVGPVCETRHLPVQALPSDAPADVHDSRY